MASDQSGESSAATQKFHEWIDKNGLREQFAKSVADNLPHLVGAGGSLLEEAYKKLEDALWKKESERKNIKRTYDPRPYLQSEFV